MFRKATRQLIAAERLQILILKQYQIFQISYFREILLLLWEKLFISKYSQKPPKDLQIYVGWAQRFLTAWNVIDHNIREGLFALRPAPNHNLVSVERYSQDDRLIPR